MNVCFNYSISLSPYLYYVPTYSSILKFTLGLLTVYPVSCSVVPGNVQLEPLHPVPAERVAEGDDDVLHVGDVHVEDFGVLCQAITSHHVTLCIKYTKPNWSYQNIIPVRTSLPFILIMQ